MTIEQIDLLLDWYRKELDQECEKGFYKWSFNKRAMMLWWAFEMLVFLNKHWLLWK